MAAGIVDVLELIHIQKQQCSSMSIALGRRDRLLELMLKAASVVKAGQRS
ncbi:MAG: hypothetical protein R3F36_05300 [Candidatus Competibacteraceae bacterium]